MGIGERPFCWRPHDNGATGDDYFWVEMVGERKNAANTEE